jgi:hypothetical protein
MELNSSREVASFASARDLPSILRNLKVYYCFQKTTPLVPNLNQIKVHAAPFNVCKIHYDIT